jgi:thiol:disulfide interchange protein DsbD
VHTTPSNANLCEAQRGLSRWVLQGRPRLTNAASRVLGIGLGLLLVCAPLAVHAISESDLLPPDEAFPLKVRVSGPQLVTLDFDIKSGYYLYRDRFSFAVDGVPVKPDQMPPGELKNDQTFGMVQVYHWPVQLRVPLPRSASRTEA